ncbi:MAG: hypothetical protein GX442_08895 [Candidatus Riflebacteria bacterium]|nr:hypothetical protein [Candidatus Riflebacteria bacterium]
MAPVMMNILPQPLPNALFPPRAWLAAVLAGLAMILGPSLEPGLLAQDLTRPGAPRMTEGARPQSPTPARPPAARPERSLVAGTISEVLLSGPEAEPDVVGVIGITTTDGESFSFQVHPYTLILVRTPESLIYVARLDQLKPGWPCQVAWDLPPDDDPPPDKPGTAFPVADHLLVDVPRP